MKADIYRCTWDSGWTQYHDDSDPLPTKWDGDPPDEIVAFVFKIEAEAEIKRLRDELELMCNVIDGETVPICVEARAAHARALLVPPNAGNNRSEPGTGEL